MTKAQKDTCATRDAALAVYAAASAAASLAYDEAILTAAREYAATISARDYAANIAAARKKRSPSVALMGRE